MKTYRSTSEVIDLLGGNRSLAALFDTTDKAVSAWRSRKFPAKTYIELKLLLLNAGIAVPDTLWAMKSGSRKHRERISWMLHLATRSPAPGPDKTL